MLQNVKTHSKLGIASCTIAAAMFLTMTVLVSASYFAGSITHDHQKIGSVWFLTSVVALFVPIPVHVVGFVLGITGLFLPNRKKLFPIIGTVLNLLFGIGSVWPWLYLGWSGLGRVQ